MIEIPINIFEFVNLKILIAIIDTAIAITSHKIQLCVSTHRKKKTNPISRQSKLSFVTSPI